MDHHFPVLAIFGMARSEGRLRFLKSLKIIKFFFVFNKETFFLYHTQLCTRVSSEMSKVFQENIT